MTPVALVPSQRGILVALERAGPVVGVLGERGAGISTVLDAVPGAVVWRPAPGPVAEPGAVLTGLLTAAADAVLADPRPALERALGRPVRAQATVRDAAEAVIEALPRLRTVVLDDLHRADGDSLAVLPALIAALGGAGVVTVLGLRSETTGSSPLREVLAALPSPGWVAVPDWDTADTAAHVLDRFGVRGAPALIAAATRGRATAAAVTARLTAWVDDDTVTVVDRRVLRTTPAACGPGPRAPGARDLAGVLEALVSGGTAAAEAEAVWLLALAPDPAAVADAAVVAAVCLARDGREVEARALLEAAPLATEDRSVLSAAVVVLAGAGDEDAPAPASGGSTTAVRWLGLVASAERAAVGGRRAEAETAATAADALAAGGPVAPLARELYPTGLTSAVRLRAGEPPTAGGLTGTDAALAALAAGRFDDVVDAARAAVAGRRGPVAGPPSGDDPALLATLAAEVSLARGLTVRADGWLDHAGDAPWSARREGTRAGVLAVTGDPAVAGARLAETVTGLVDRGAWRDVPALAHRLAALAGRTGDRRTADLARAATDRAAEIAGPGSRAAWHRLLTRAAVVADPDAATAALRLAETRGSPTELAWSRLAVGVAGVEPATHLRAAYATFAAADAALWAAAVARAARSAGVRLPPDDPEDGPATRLLARLVTDGLTNRRIATVLGISERGVEARLATLSRRWGATSRAALAGEWLGREPA